MKNILITGGAGFIASNLINLMIQKNKKLIIYSYDNYSTGSKRNHIKSKKVKYLRGDTLNAYYKAEMILRNKHAIQKRSCGCQYGSMARAVDKLYQDYLIDNK